MPRLPDKTALGQDPSLNTQQRIITGQDYGAGIVAGATGDLGQSISNVGNEIQQQTDHIQLAQAETDRIKGTMDADYQIRQDSDYNTYLPRFDAATAKINADAAAQISNPQARQLFLARAGQETRRYRMGVESQANQYRQQDLHVSTGNLVDATLGELRDPSTTPERAQQILANADAEITGAGKSGLSPNHVQDLREKHLGGINSALYRYANERLWDQSDPDSALNTLNDLKVGPTSGGGDATTDFIKRQEGFTPKAKWDNKQYSVGYGTVAAPGESVTKDEAEKRLKEQTGRIGEWIDDNITAHLSPKQRTALTSFAYNLGTGAGGLSDLKDDINSGNFDRAAQRMQSYNRAGGQANIGLARRRREEADLLRSGPDSDAGSPDTAGQSGWAPLYRKYLSPTAIYHLTTNAQRAMHARLLQEGQDAVEKVSSTGQMPTDDNGRTVLDRAARGGLLPNQVEKLKNQIDGAQDIYTNLQGLADLTPDDQQKRLASLSPETRTSAAKGKGETPASYSQMQKTQDAVGNYVARLQKWRDEDPAAYVEGGNLSKGSSQRVVASPDGGFDVVDDPRSESKHFVPPAPEVANARAYAKANNLDPQKQNEILIDARLAAQTRRGIPTSAQHTLTLSEARNLLQVGARPPTDDAEIEKIVTDAKTRAAQGYGRYAGQAVRDAIDLTMRSWKQHEAATGYLGTVVSGRMPPEVLNSILSGTRSAAEGRGTVPQFNIGQPTADETRRWPEPNPDAARAFFQKYKNNESTARTAFDAKYGPGASDRQLGPYQGPFDERYGPRRPEPKK